MNGKTKLHHNYYDCLIASNFLFAANFSDMAFQTTVKSMAFNAFAVSLLVSPRKRRPVTPSDSIIFLAASMYPIGSTDVCLYVFRTRIALEQTSDTNDDWMM